MGSLREYINYYKKNWHIFLLGFGINIGMIIILAMVGFILYMRLMNELIVELILGTIMVFFTTVPFWISNVTLVKRLKKEDPRINTVLTIIVYQTISSIPYCIITFVISLFISP